MIDKLYENMLTVDRKPFSKRLDKKSLVDFIQSDLDSGTRVFESLPKLQQKFFTIWKKEELGKGLDSPEKIEDEFFLLSNGKIIDLYRHNDAKDKLKVSWDTWLLTGVLRGNFEVGVRGGALSLERHVRANVSFKQIQTVLKIIDLRDPKAVYIDIMDKESTETVRSYAIKSDILNRKVFVNKVKMALKKSKESIQESSIDFPRDGLDPVIWAKEDDEYILREDVKKKIFGILERYPDVPLLEIAKEIHIVGSICTNQFLDSADLDCHIIPKNPDDWSEKGVKLLMDWFNTHRDEISGFIEKHPAEVYIQLNPNQDLMSDGCYSILEDKWLVGPKIVPASTDPYNDFSHIAQDIKDEVADADRLFSELKRDVIDFEVIKQAMEEMSGEDRKRLHQKLQSKLEELEDGIEALYKERGEWVDARHSASKPETPEQALKDVELAKNWKDINARFKFINRYQYLRIINSLEELLADEKISSEEVPIIKRIMGVDDAH